MTSSSPQAAGRCPRCARPWTSIATPRSRSQSRSRAARLGGPAPRAARARRTVMTAAAIELAGVSKSFGQKVVLDAVDMRVDEGTVCGFLGANGAGKTTTVRLLLGLLPADAGQVRVLGLDPAVNGKEVRRRVGVLLDHDGHYERLTALQNLEFHADIRKLDRTSSRRRMEELLRGDGALGEPERARRDLLERHASEARRRTRASRATPALVVGRALHGARSGDRRRPAGSSSRACERRGRVDSSDDA